MAASVLLQLLVAVFIPAMAEVNIEFTKYPESVTAPVGDEVTFDCAVRVPGERLAWRWKPVDRFADQWMDANGTSDKDTTSTRLVLKIKENTPSSLYQCVAWYGAVSLASIPARLDVARIDLSRNSAEKRVISAPLHNTVVLHCKPPLSEPPAILSWYKEVKDGPVRKWEAPHGVLVLHNVTVEDSGTYACTATNELSGQVVNLPERTYLRVQHEGEGGVRFLETEDFVGTVDSNDVLTLPVKPGGALRVWCGAVGTPPPKVQWKKDGENLPRKREHMLTLAPFTTANEGVYTCLANGIARSWKVIALQPPLWEGSVSSVNASEGNSTRITCGTPMGQPVPTVSWMLNAEPLRTGKGVRVSDTDLYINPVEKRHAGLVQCFACNTLGCAYDAALLTVVPEQISDQAPKTMHFPSQPPKRHNKNSRKHKEVMIPPSRPNLTRMSDNSVMVSWTNGKHGLPILFFKVQYRESSNSSSGQWQTATDVIRPHIHAYQIDGLTPDRYYKFRIAAVYSNQDNKMGRSSARFYLQRGGFQKPNAPVFTRAVVLSPHGIQVEWTWSRGEGVEAEGFYIYYRAVTTMANYEKVTAPGGASARSAALSHLLPDTVYEFKVQAFTAQAPSDFSSIEVARTQKLRTAPQETTSEAPVEDLKDSPRGPGTLATAGGVLGAAALLVLLVVTLLLCRRAKRPSANEEKGSVPESGGANGYIPAKAKVPIIITANPMHAEGGENGVEMSFLHNNNCGNPAGNDDTLPHSRKNGPASRQYV